MTHSFKGHMNRRNFLALTGSTPLATRLAGTGALILPSRARADSHEWTLEVTNPSENVYQYNGKETGPIISAGAGETIVVNLINSMEATEEDCPEDINTEHGLNITNLHTHGLHVSPVLNDSEDFDSDNVFLQVVPIGQSDCHHPENMREGANTYHFDLPDDHPPGTHWYHAHKHGSTNRQVAGGLAGPLIINDPPGHMPQYIANAPERVFMITGGRAIEVDPDGGGQTGNPVTLAPGAVERWRIINADPRANSFVRIDTDSEEIELWQIAYDGLTYEKAVFLEPGDDRDPWESPSSLGPGNRMDVMVRVNPIASQGSIAVTAQQVPAQFLHEIEDSNLTLAADPVDIEIVVAGASDNKPWNPEAQLPGSGLEPVEGPFAETRRVVFDLAFPRYMINDRQFGEESEPLFQMALDSVEEWVLENKNGGIHPFHIHVNPFYVTHINDEELAEDNPLRRWQDVISIPGNGTIKFRTRFIDFTGKFVIHCHILDHEDRGMMRVVEVV